MTPKPLEDLKVDGRRVLLRLDLDVAMDDDRQVLDDSKLLLALPTLQNLIQRESRVIIAAHLGPPTGERKPEWSLEPVAVRLAQLLDTELILSEDAIGDGPRKMASALREGQLMLLENLHYYPGECGNDDTFAKQLASMADVFVNDAFGTLHLNYASVAGVPKVLKDHGIGLQATREIQALGKLTIRPARPFLGVVGGARIKDKVDLLLGLANRVDQLYIGGAIALTFLSLQGARLGKTRIEIENLTLAERVLRKAHKNGVELILPEDHVIVQQLEASAPWEVTSNAEFPEGHVAVDLGPKSLDRLLHCVGRASTVFWNGPLGIAELPPFHRASSALAQAVGRGNAYSVACGADTLQTLRMEGMTPFFSHVSTGGSSTIQWLAGQALPGMQVLEDKHD